MGYVRQVKDQTLEIGGLIEAIGTSQFAEALSTTLSGVAPFDYTVIFAYLGSARPRDLFDNFPTSKRNIFVRDYQDGPYLLDPFYLACTKGVEPGLYKLMDLAPDRFFQGEYYRSYYVQTGLDEEIGYFVDLPGKVTIVVSLMRAEKSFSVKEVRELKKFWPVVRAAARQNWKHLSSSFDGGNQSEATILINDSVEYAFLNLGRDILTPREREVVEFTLKGHSADAVGRILQIASGTVRIHRRNIYSKLRIRSQGELFSLFIEALSAVSPTNGVGGAD